MRRIGLAVILAVGLTLASLAVGAQPAEKGKISLIGVIWLGPPPSPATKSDANAEE